MASVSAQTVLILGAGFAGISLAKELSRLTKKDRTVEIHLVNQENYFVFQPMLPEVVSCAIEPSHILNPIRHLCPNVHVHQATISGIDLETRQVTVVGTDSRRPRKLPYDHLVLSLGLTMNLAAVPGMAEHALPFKTLGAGRRSPRAGCFKGRMMSAYRAICHEAGETGCSKYSSGRPQPIPPEFSIQRSWSNGSGRQAL